MRQRRIEFLYNSVEHLAFAKVTRIRLNCSGARLVNHSNFCRMNTSFLLNFHPADDEETRIMTQLPRIMRVTTVLLVKFFFVLQDLM